jgi:hypothetical protein
VQQLDFTFSQCNVQMPLTQLTSAGKIGFAELINDPFGTRQERQRAKAAARVAGCLLGEAAEA